MRPLLKPRFPSSLPQPPGGGRCLQQSPPFVFRKQTEAKSQALAKRGPEMGVPGPSCHRSSLSTPSACLSLDAGSSCSLETTGDSKAVAEPGLSQAPAPCAHPQCRSGPFPDTCARGFRLAHPRCLRGIWGCQGGGRSTGRWHWSSHPAWCVGIRGHLGSCFLEEGAQCR